MPKTAVHAAPPPVDDPGSLTTRIAQLERQLSLARAQNAYLHRELATALKHAPMAPVDASTEETLRLENQDLRQRYGTLTQHYQQAQQTIAVLRYNLDLAHTIMGWTQSPADLPLDLLVGPGSALDTLLVHLLTLAHPDRWSQGQLATELAHELAVAINAQRTQLAHG